MLVLEILEDIVFKKIYGERSLLGNAFLNWGVREFKQQFALMQLRLPHGGIPCWDIWQ